MYVGRLRKYNLYLLWLQVNGSGATISQSSKLGCLISIAHGARREYQFYCVWQWWEKKGKWPSMLQIFLLFLQKLPPSNILCHSPSAVDSPFSALAKGLLGSLFISSCLVSLTVSSQLLLFLELQPPYQFQEAFLDPPAPAGSHDELMFCAYWCVSPKRLKTAYRWKYISCYCILCAQSKS